MKQPELIVTELVGSRPTLAKCTNCGTTFYIGAWIRSPEEHQHQLEKLFSQHLFEGCK